jgi:hypothetical protein
MDQTECNVAGLFVDSLESAVGQGVPRSAAA